MNPSEDEYMDYYSDYDFPDTYDHIGDISDLVS